MGTHGGVFLQPISRTPRSSHGLIRFGTVLGRESSPFNAMTEHCPWSTPERERGNDIGALGGSTYPDHDTALHTTPGWQWRCGLTPPTSHDRRTSRTMICTSLWLQLGLIGPDDMSDRSTSIFGERHLALCHLICKMNIVSGFIISYGSADLRAVICHHLSQASLHNPSLSTNSSAFTSIPAVLSSSIPNAKNTTSSI